MADVFTKEKRSAIMSKIRAKNTGIEKRVFSFLRKNKVYHQRHYAKAPGKPDLAVPSRKIAVFINGDFWHGYRFSSWRKRVPRMYWRQKIESNIARDKRNIRKLRRLGWRVLRVWGHELNTKNEKILEKIADFLKSD